VRVVLQRTTRALVRVNGLVVGAIGRGYVLLVGFAATDADEQLRWMADRIISLRLFPDEVQPADEQAPRKPSSFSRTLRDVDGGILVVSQFTLYGDTRKGTRPSFTDAAPPDIAIQLYDRFVALLRERAPGAVETGEFGAMMEVELANDGPVTLVLER
jgi:D-aminoacyl-tRNA deacylase